MNKTFLMKNLWTILEKSLEKTFRKKFKSKSFEEKDFVK
jgi:hypothetical protein